MFYALSWFAVIALLALWSLAAWALHAVAVWTVSGCRTEVVFVEGHSSDDTYVAIERAAAAHPGRDIRLIKQTGKGKGDPVRLGFENAHGEILIILDADLSVPPENLGRFYDALINGRGDFINGVRLVYPLEEQSMRFLNLVGNKFFSLAFSWLLGQPIKDTLCGTKVLWREDYEYIASNRDYFGNFDPFGDFDLLFGAARLNLKIIDLPIRYGRIPRSKKLKRKILIVVFSLLGLIVWTHRMVVHLESRKMYRLR